jgi:hypothetical protein
MPGICYTLILDIGVGIHKVAFRGPNKELLHPVES